MSESRMVDLCWSKVSMMSETQSTMLAKWPWMATTRSVEPGQHGKGWLVEEFQDAKFFEARLFESSTNPKNFA